MSSLSMFIVETSRRDKKAAKFARQSTPVFLATYPSPLTSDAKIDALSLYGFLAMSVISALLLREHPIGLFYIGLGFSFIVATGSHNRYSLELYGDYLRQRHALITERRVVELPVEMLDAWMLAFHRLGIDISSDEAANEFKRLCYDPYTRKRLIRQGRLVVAARDTAGYQLALAHMRNVMSEILRGRIEDRQIDTRPSRLVK